METTKTPRTGTLKHARTLAHFRTMESIRREYAPGEGAHWFDRDTLRFFRTRLPEGGYSGPGGVFFVTSEKSPHGPRRYTVRHLTGPGRIHTVGKFCTLPRFTADRLALKYAAYGLPAAAPVEE